MKITGESSDIKNNANQPDPHYSLATNSTIMELLSAESRIKAHGEKAKLPKDRRHFHVLKHSMDIVAAGLDLLVVRDRLGHQSINNTLVYAQLLNPKRDAEMFRVFRSKSTA